MSVQTETKPGKSAAQEDLALIERIVIRGDQQAFRLLYRRYSAEVLRRLHRLVGRPDVAEDALQQVFVEVHRSLPSFRAESSFRTWLHRITERVAMAVYRDQWRSRSLLERWQLSAGDEPEQLPNQPGRQLEQEDLHTWMRQFLDRLSPKKRIVLLMCDLEERPYDEVAESQGISEGTVASRLHHARKDLRKMMEHALKKQGLRYEDWFDDR